MVNHPNRNRRHGFILGQLILWQNDLREAWEFDCYFCDRLMVRARRGNAVLSAPVEAWIAASEGWQDAPPLPDFYVSRYDRLTFVDECEADKAQSAVILDWQMRFDKWDAAHRQPLLKRLQEIGR